MEKVILSYKNGTGEIGKYEHQCSTKTGVKLRYEVLTIKKNNNKLGI